MKLLDSRNLEGSAAETPGIHVSDEEKAARDQLAGLDSEPSSTVVASVETPAHIETPSATLANAAVQETQNLSPDDILNQPTDIKSSEPTTESYKRQFQGEEGKAATRSQILQRIIDRYKAQNPHDMMSAAIGEVPENPEAKKE